MSEESPHVKSLLAYHHERREQLIRTLRSLPEGPVRDDVLASLKARDRAIVAPEKRDYRLPAHFAKTMHSQALAELRTLLAELWRFREQMVGLTEFAAEAIYSGDPMAMLLRDAFADWALGHLRARLSKPCPKDRGDSVRTFLRLNNEFVDWLGSLCSSSASGHTLVLSDVVCLVEWELYRQTWRDKVKVLSTQVLIELKDPSYRRGALSYLESRGFLDEDALYRIRQTYHAVALAEDQLPDDVPLELRCMAADLMEMQGRLTRSYRSSEHVVMVAPGVYACWDWAFRHRAGLVTLGFSEQQVREQQLVGDIATVSVGLDGVLMDPTVPTKCFDSTDMLRWTLGLLRPLHARLFELWEQTGPMTPVLELGEDEVDDVAAIAVAAEAIIDDDDPTPEPTRGARVRVPAVRTSKLLGVLERHFGCEVSRGKGSEITVYRPGGKIYTLPGHQRNTHYPTWMIRALLKTVGIPAVEFAQVVCKRVQKH